jgi:serine/threonine protein kinase
LHNDIKPENFLMGLGKQKNQLFIIDFGLSTRWRNSKTGAHIPFGENVPFSGTPRFASASTLRGNTPSRRDDLESLAYVWLWLLKGKLPWSVPGATQESICLAKAKAAPERLFEGFPSGFSIYLSKVRGYRFVDTPDYAGLRKLLRDALVCQYGAYDYQYDWTLNKTESRGKK